MRHSPASEFDDRPPSRSQRKRDADALWQIGMSLLELSEQHLQHPGISAEVRAALADYRRFPTMEAKRRQMQYIAKLLRVTDPDALDAALHAHQRNKQRDTDTLSEAENWRQRLLTEDQAWDDWCHQVPQGNQKALRGLLTNARREWQQAVDRALPGEAPKKGKLYKELFQKLRATLLARNQAQD
ncbi:ribosome biogenesis factor YjgA [Sinimarinibacterium sp. NLF-5-8]|uniref:ribosome biogenesis factor YjgA n=1 Tax=Sinimarinibacterium sp. NLF-5-8 TaxID=2698684 RepID=UPI00137BEED9|nr:ribosome biogenesis factor YjgA [Sinimarinibacterium sp. NLF-5-8]QHS09640.1 DUF615 domain-containing protein [Sinimarinibacterium sp. NLF-5-8]